MLPKDFYNAERELEKLLEKQEGGPLSRGQIYPLIEMLTIQMESIFFVEGAFPSNLAAILIGLISNRYLKNEYEGKVVCVLKRATQQPGWPQMGDALSYIRKLYEKNEDLLLTMRREISYTKGNDSYEIKYELFAETLKRITVEHVEEVINRIVYFIAEERQRDRVVSAPKNNTPEFCIFSVQVKSLQKLSTFCKKFSQPSLDHDNNERLYSRLQRSLK